MTTPTGEPAGAGMELLPCPFCGGEAELREVGLLPDYGYVVGCTNCDGQIGDTDEPWIQAGHAIAAWNRRTAIAQHEQLQQRVMELTTERDALAAKVAELENELTKARFALGEWGDSEDE